MQLFGVIMRLNSVIVPFMIVLSFPLVFSLVEEVQHLLCHSKEASLRANRKRLVSMFAMVYLPYLLGIFTTTIPALNGAHTNALEFNSLGLYTIVGFLILGSTPVFLHHFLSSVTSKAKIGSINLTALWLGLSTSFLYLSLCLKLFEYYYSTLAQ